MKQLVLLIFLFILSACSNTDSSSKRPNNPLGLGPIGGKETPQPNVKDNETNEAKLAPVLAMCQRAITWLNLVNEKRDLQNRLNLADRKSKNPVPLEKPKIVSTDIFEVQFPDEYLEINFWDELKIPINYKNYSMITIADIKKMFFNKVTVAIKKK